MKSQRHIYQDRSIYAIYAGNMLRQTYSIVSFNCVCLCVFLTKEISLEENNGYQAHLICINWDVVNDQLSGLKPLFNFKKSSNIHYNIWVHFIFVWVNILLYFIRSFWETENKGKLRGNLKAISNQFLSLAVSHYAALSSHYYYFFCK